MIDKILKEYREAFIENIEAAKEETSAKVRRRKAHNDLLRLKQELRAITDEALEDTMIIQ